MIGTGAMCDPYLHCEEELQLTRKCLSVIERHGFGLTIQTKSTRLLRDVDLFCKINEKAKCVVQMTLTTYDESLCRIVEPNVSTTRERFEALEILRDLGIPTMVWMTPILPYLNDTRENIEGILNYCIRAKVKGIICFGMGLTLREGDREYYYAALDRHFPGLKERYIHRYGNAYELPSDHSAELLTLFHDTCQKHGILHDPDECFSYLHEFPEPYEQLSLF